MSTRRGRYGDPRKRTAAEQAAHTYADQRAAVNPDGRNIAACRPVKMPPDLDLPPGVDPGPMVDDTIRRCERCGQDCWVGPINLSLVDTGKATVMCLACTVAVAGDGAPVVDVDPGRVERPRR